MTTWITISIIALAPMLLRLPRAFAPLRLNANDPSRFRRPFSHFAVHSITGIASDVNQRSDSYTSGSIGSTSKVDGSGIENVSGSINTKVVVTDQFFLEDGQGNVESFQLTDFEAAIGTGHVVSVVWAVKRLRRSGPYFLIYDHTTRRTFFNNKVLTKTFTFPYPTLYIALLLLMIMPIPVVLFFALLSEWWQIPRFRNVGIQPLLSALDSEASHLEAQRSSPALTAERSADTTGLADELERIAEMRRSGLLSDAEFEAAKAKLFAS